MKRATIAALTLGAAMLFPNWPAAHVVTGDMVTPPRPEDNERERLTRENLANRA